MTSKVLSRKALFHYFESYFFFSQLVVMLQSDWPICCCWEEYWPCHLHQHVMHWKNWECIDTGEIPLWWWKVYLEQTLGRVIGFLWCPGQLLPVPAPKWWQPWLGNLTLVKLLVIPGYSVSLISFLMMGEYELFS